MYTAADLMTRTLVTLREDDTLDEADHYLELANIRHLPVVSGRKLVGLVTHRDLLRHCRRKDPRTGRQITAGEAMTREVKAVRPETSAREVIRILRTHKFGCLPVTLQSGALVGIITEHDLLRIAEQWIEQLDLREEGASYEP